MTTSWQLHIRMLMLWLILKLWQRKQIRYCHRKIRYCHRKIRYCHRKIGCCNRKIRYCHRKIRYCHRKIRYCHRKIRYWHRKIRYCHRKIRYCHLQNYIENARTIKSKRSFIDRLKRISHKTDFCRPPEIIVSRGLYVLFIRTHRLRYVRKE